MTNSGRRWSARRLARGRPAALLLLLAVAVGVGARLAIQSVNPIFASDTFQNLLLAEALVEGRGFTSGGAEHPDVSRSVLFPAAIAAATAITRDVEWSARAVVVLAGALIVVPMFFFARTTFGPASALASLPLGALSCSVAASSRLLSTSLYILLAAMSFALVWSAGRGRSRATWLAAGAAAGFAALARPEGLAFPPVIVAWALWGGRRSSLGGRRDRRRAAACAGSVLAAFLAVYLPYVAWASSALGRFEPAPGIEYVKSQRDVSDHLGLRDIPSPVAWSTRAQFMLTKDHGSLFLERYFRQGSFPEPDPDVVIAAPEPADRTAGSQPSARWRYVLLRRLEIIHENSIRALYYAAWEHFFPPVVVGLALIGLVTAFGSRRGRSALTLLVLVGVASLAPLASHVEERFFYVPFVIGTLLAAGGWWALAWQLGRVRRSPLSHRWVRVVTHGVLVVAIAVSGARHEGNQGEAVVRARLLRASAESLSGRLPPGPVLAIAPHVPFWSGHPYRPIPFATRDGILDYARAQGAHAVVVEGARDLADRPDLAWLAGRDVAAPYRLVLSAPHPSGGSLLVYAIDPGETARR